MEATTTQAPPHTTQHPKVEPAKPKLPDHVLRAIRGEISEEEKKEAYNESLGSWWKEYASRKNDEEEEHVADSLLYDERCHLPRTTPPPVLDKPPK